MITLNCVRHCSSPQDWDTLHEYIGIHSPGGYAKNHRGFGTGGGMYWPRFLEGARGTDVERRLLQPAAVHDEVFPELRAPSELRLAPAQRGRL